MNRRIKIGHCEIGSDRPTFVIAEAGVNHNGDLDLARQLIRSAKQTGANCVKFQTFKADRVVTANAPKARYQLHTTDPQESQRRMLETLELSAESYGELIQLCRDEQIIFMSTPYNPEDVDFLMKFDVPAFKLASIHVAEPYFLQYVARTGKPMILSTGMATLAEVDTAVQAIRSTGHEEFILLQCTTNYPSKLEDTHLRAMQTLANSFETLVGYSDHTQTNTACIAAIALGACVIEKHFTLDQSLPGPDQSTSLEPAAFTQLVQQIREAELVLGNRQKQPSSIEQINAVGMRRSLVASRAISAGEAIAPDMITCKRPATGLKPAWFSDIVGRVALRDIAPDELLCWEMLGARQEEGDG